MSSESPTTKAERLRIPGTIWALGFVSLFMDLSSELVHSLLPVFLVTTLGASALTVGVIEGIAESTAMLVRNARQNILGCYQRLYRAAQRIAVTPETIIVQAGCRRMAIGLSNSPVAQSALATGGFGMAS